MNLWLGKTAYVNNPFRSVDYYLHMTSVLNCTQLFLYNEAGIPIAALNLDLSVVI